MFIPIAGVQSVYIPIYAYRKPGPINRLSLEKQKTFPYHFSTICAVENNKYDAFSRKKIIRVAYIGMRVCVYKTYIYSRKHEARIIDGSSLILLRESARVESPSSSSGSILTCLRFYFDRAGLSPLVVFGAAPLPSTSGTIAANGALGYQ